MCTRVTMLKHMQLRWVSTLTSQSQPNLWMVLLSEAFSPLWFGRKLITSSHYGWKSFFMVDYCNVNLEITLHVWPSESYPQSNTHARASTCVSTHNAQGTGNNLIMKSSTKYLQLSIIVYHRLKEIALIHEIWILYFQFLCRVWGGKWWVY